MKTGENHAEMSIKTNPTQSLSSSHMPSDLLANAKADAHIYVNVGFFGMNAIGKTNSNISGHEYIIFIRKNKIKLLDICYTIVR